MKIETAPNVPEYETQLNAYHTTFKNELKETIAALPLASGHNVLDVGCGDGFYTALLAERLEGNGTVVGVDASPDYLELAQTNLQQHPYGSHIRWVQGEIARLPFPDDNFDVVWCAQSLYSFPDPLEALNEMRRVVKRGGVVAVMDNDTLHEVLLPWPPIMELRLRTAELAAFESKNENAKKYYVARDLTTLFERAGLQTEQKLSFSRDRIAPLDPACRTYLEIYVRDLKKRVWPYLDEEDRLLCDPFLDPQSRRYILDIPTLCATFIEHVVIGKKT